MNDAIFSQLDFGPLDEFLREDNVTDISYSNGGQVWLKTLDKGVYQVNRPEINNALMEKLAFQCANVMGKTFNMAHPMLDAESAELRMNFVHESIATNGIACLIRKTPAKIRLNREKLIEEKYVSADLLDFLLKCVEGHANIIVSGETGSGKTELVKYLASHIKENEKIISIEDTLELHLDRIFPHRDIVALKTNNVASYSDILVACMRQNPIWILLSEVRSAEAVMAVRNSISSGHHILSTIHSDKARLIPMRMFALIESNIDVEQFVTTIHRYVQIGIYVKGYMSAELGRFQREILEVCEFYVDDDNKPQVNIIYQKTLTGDITINNPTKHLKDYLGIGGVDIGDDIFHINTPRTETPKEASTEIPLVENNNNSNVETLSESGEAAPSTASSPVTVQPQANTQPVIPTQPTVSSSTQMIRQAINNQQMPGVVPQANTSVSANPVIATPPGTNPGTL